MKKRHIISIHAGIFIVLAVIALLTSEQLLNLMMPGFSNVDSWIMLVITEMMLLLIVVLISCIIFIRKQANRNK